jgi:hypothetical protein
MDPLTTTIPRTGIYGDMPFPVTLVDVPRITVVPQVMTTTKTLPLLRIDAKAVLGKTTTVSRSEGEKIYPLIKAALREGRKVQLSVKGLNLSGWFFDTAICMLYGDFDQDTVDNNVEVVDIPETDNITLRNMKRIRRLYYYHRPLFDERMRISDPDLDCSKDSAGYCVSDSGDIYAPGFRPFVYYDEDDQEKDFNGEDE